MGLALYLRKFIKPPEMIQEADIDFSEVGTYKLFPVRYEMSPCWMIKYCDIDGSGIPIWKNWDGESDVDTGRSKYFNSKEEAIEKYSD